MIRAIKFALQPFIWLWQQALRRKATSVDGHPTLAIGLQESNRQLTPTPEAVTRDPSSDQQSSSGEEEGAGDKKPPRNEDPSDTESKGGQEPPDISGRRGKSSPNRGSETPARPEPLPESPSARPELICRQPVGSWAWEVALLIDDERQAKEVRHNGTPLRADRGVYHLASYRGALSVSFEDGGEHQLPLFDGKPLIFKMRDKWHGDGRRVALMTKGHFVVIVPNAWERTGYEPVEPENCADPGFTAHFFYRGEDEADFGGFRGHDIPLSDSGLKLTGRKIFDDSRDGDLFVGATPELAVPQNVIWARVGEEVKGGWGKNFKPDEQTLDDVLGDRQGRFFIRVYDGERALLDSDQFRYLRHLNAIHVNGEPYTRDTLLIPTTNGHSPTKIRFVGGEGNIIRVTPSPRNMNCVTVNGDTLIAKPVPACDKVSCALESSGGTIDVVVDLPRIWWGIGRSEDGPGKWADKPFTMTRQKFRKQARDSRMSLRLRLPERVNSVRVGFAGEVDRQYRRRDTYRAEYGIVIPLVEFADYSQIVEPLNKDALFAVQCGGLELPIIKVLADRRANPEPDSGRQGHVASLRSMVKSRKGWRRGKGFSIDEIRDAGLTPGDGADWPRVDRRRRSRHQVNVDTLMER